MTTRDDAHFQWTQAIHRDLVNLRDTHLAHVQEDLHTLKTDMKTIKADVDELKNLKEEALLAVSRISWRVLFIVIAALGGVAGVPMAMEGI